MRRFFRWFKRLFNKVPAKPIIVSPEIVENFFTPSNYIGHYQNLWDSMEIRDSKASTIAWYVKQLIRNSERYQSIEAVSNVPWQVVGCLHLLESGGDFAGVLHNGEKIIGTGKKTRLVPKGRGPFDTWEQAAIDALSIKKQPKDWSIVNTLHYCERYNGPGYLRDSRKPHSPYLWSFSNHYTKGKYISDGKYSSTYVSKQCGIAVILKEIGYLD